MAETYRNTHIHETWTERYLTNNLRSVAFARLYYVYYYIHTHTHTHTHIYISVAQLIQHDAQIQYYGCNELCHLQVWEGTHSKNYKGFCWCVLLHVVTVGIVARIRRRL
jgi:hypothetical protein